MLKIILKISLVIFLFTISSFSYDNLYIQDPQNWYGGQGTIEEATLSVKPCGIYTEYGLYLTFSARDLGFSHTDTVEVQLMFDLPQNAVVIDSWLWVYDEIVKAEILDVWTASSIYEEIVNRRRDPSILYNRGNGQYELRVFPMAGDETRKVKITYLVPAEWNSTKVISPLPLNIINTSLYPVDKLELHTYLDSSWTTPSILELPSITFESDTGGFLKAEIPSEAFSGSLNFSLDSPLNNGIYVNQFNGDVEGFYQMVFLPSQVLDISVSNKVVFLIDYESSKSTVTKSDLISSLKSTVLTNLTDKDSFNIILSKANIQRLSETWLSADSANVESIFSSLTENTISSYSSLPALMADGIDFVKNNGNDASLILISCTDQVGEYSVANQLINDLMALMDPKLPIHVVDFQDQNYYYHWFGGQYYMGNEYFYRNITRLTSGHYFTLLNNYSATFPGILKDAFQSLSGFINSFDLHTKLDNGFCYGRYTLGANTNAIYLNKPIMQVGKFKGNFPFIIEASGVFETEPFSEVYSLEENDLHEADSINEEVWTGNYVDYLQRQNQNNDIIGEIIYYSLKERILSIYTAFLCLEPGMEVCLDCVNNEDDGGGEWVIDVEDEEKTDEKDTLIINGYPNPFNSEINLQVTLPKNVDIKNVSFKIFDILGQVVKSFEADVSGEKRTFRFTWNGISDNGIYAASGNYFFIVTTPQKVYSIKLVLLK